MASMREGIGRAGLGAVSHGDAIFLVGGHNSAGPLRKLERFVPDPGKTRGGTWDALPDMLARRSYLAAVGVASRIFAVGGSADGRALNTIESFCPSGVEWEHWFQMPPMQTKRTLHAAAMGQDTLFVTGGFDGTRDMATTECYDPATNTWKWKDVMNVKRSYHAMCPASYVDERGERHSCLYSLGGQNRLDEHGLRALDSVEAFDLHSERWYDKAPLPEGRLGAAAGTLVDALGEEWIYVCGGSNGDETLCTAVRYHVRTNGWSDAPPMAKQRLGHVAAVQGNKLYVFGGFDGTEALDTFEVFDPIEGCWGSLLKMGVRDEADLEARDA
uniref:Uncharacterized protein n=1 Tax=Noctiluca scintillans TaxID=2966 RepID=A0A7S1F9I8_NOCSC|mmetsp:Transcript_45364/g.120301  ORF Transcript_45364/g.120301 Transcript_45364/m.120301 type:complete len:329 (+) Transcript_45364:67-1053(+)